MKRGSLCRQSMILSLAAALTGGTASSARAEGEPRSLKARLRSTLSFDASGGGVTHLFGGVTDPGRGTLQLAVHARIPLTVRPGFELDYVAGLVPVERAFGTRVGNAGSPDQTLRTETVFGAGVDGIGLVARLRGSDRWQPYVGLVGGVRLFEKAVPSPRGMRFNFSADLGAGVAMRFAPRRWIGLGITLHHLSNGGLGRANPSFNAFDVTVSLSRS